MTPYDWYRVGVDIITIAIIPVSVVISRLLKTIKTNDLVHVDLKLDEIKKVIDSTENKLDRHLEWHLNQKG